MKEPSFLRILSRSAARGLFGQAPGDREFCENRDRILHMEETTGLLTRAVPAPFPFFS